MRCHFDAMEVRVADAPRAGRDRRRGRRDGGRPPAAAGRRLGEGRDQGAGWPKIRIRRRRGPGTGAGREHGLRNRFSLALGFAVLALSAGAAAAQEEIKIGEINSYSGAAGLHASPTARAGSSRVEEINAAGGVGGRKIVDRLEGRRRQAGGRGDAPRTSSSTREKVDHARRHLPLQHRPRGRRLTRKQQQEVSSSPPSRSPTRSSGRGATATPSACGPRTYMQAAMLAEEAAKLPAKRWATVAPNYEYGQSAVSVFKELLGEASPDIEFVAEQWPAHGQDRRRRRGAGARGSRSPRRSSTSPSAPTS